MKASKICEIATNTALGNYGKVMYRNGSAYIPDYRYNVMLWVNNAWHCDCLGFVHTMVNGFTGDKSKLGGGAVMDNFVLNSDEYTTLTKYCKEASNNFKSIVKGEFLYMSGHVGLYIGEIKPFKDGRVFNTAECTLAFGGGAMLTYVDNSGRRYNHKGGTQSAAWEKHAKFSAVDYSTDKTLKPLEIIDIVKDVLNGKYGNNPKRQETIAKKYGEKIYRKVQDIINILFS